VILSTDKLRIFVSSTLRECADERAVARRAIRSINHSPILFEDLGARPHPPRTMYLRGLNQAHVFVGIYRDNYGWTAPGMSISGLEDELRLARELGLPRLLYEYRPGDKRDARLAELLDEVKQDTVTVSHYEEAAELFDRMRDDITAIVAERFVGIGVADSIPPAPPKERLTRLARSLGPLIARPDLATALVAQVSRDSAVAVVGPAGAGKTVLLTQVAASEGWAFVDVEGLTPARVLVRCINALASESGDNDPVLPPAGNVEDSFLEAWKHAHRVTLVVDGAESPEDIVSLVLAAGGATPDRRLIVTSRVVSHAIAGFNLPPWSSREIAEFLQAAGDTSRLDEVDRLLAASAGNPLYLRFSVLQPGGGTAATLKRFELDTFARLDPRARELLTYLALLRAPVGFAMLGELLADPPLAPEAVTQLVASIPELLKDTDQGLGLVHPHFGETILADLLASKVRSSFYVERLAQVLRRRGDMLSAYYVLAAVGHPRASEVLPEAAFMATARGEIGTALQLLERRLDLARTRIDRAGSLNALLSLAILSAQAGKVDASRDWLRQAEEQLGSNPDADWALHIRETAAQVELTFGGTTKALASLAELRRAYESNGDVYGLARIDLHLSTTYIQTSRFDEALAASERALDGFTQSGDDYGLRLAKANRAVALSAIPRRAAEADPVLAELEREATGSSTRMRALICNLLARRHRENGDPATARQYAMEAIELGEKLGDRQVAVLNRINLGNTYRDEGAADVPGAYDRAMAAYDQARGEATRFGFRAIEAQALRLQASVHRRQERFALALTDAEAAIAIASGTVDVSGLAEAHQERAKALKGMRRYSDASAAFLAAASIALGNEGTTSYYFDLVRRALAVDALGDQTPTANLLDGLLGLFGDSGKAGEKTPSTFRERVDQVLRGYLRGMAEVPTAEVFATSVMLLNTILRNCPTKLAEAIVLESTEELLRDAPPTRTRPYLLALVAFLTSRAAPALALATLVRLVESLPNVPGLYFRPQEDGAAHWTLRLDLGRPVICTITQMDSSTNGFFVALVVAALCWAFQDQLYSRLLLGIPLARSEAAFNVSAVGILPEHLRETLRFEGPCSVSRATNPKSDEQVPIVVLYKEHELTNLRTDGQGAGAVQSLSGGVLIELVYHLLKGEVDFESLGPKVVSLVREVY
jgi:tetratricopeptide (TPR) repeat protein